MPDAYSAAAASLRDPSYCRTSKALNDREPPYKGADERVYKFAAGVVKQAQLLHIPLRAHCIFRGEAEQGRLWALGHSKAKWGQSAHNYGMAVDIIHAVRGWQLNESEWELVGVICKEVARRQNLRVTWGGHWWWDAKRPGKALASPDTPNDLGWDPAHWELTKWKEEASLFPY